MKQHGFSLLEFLIVIVIVMILLSATSLLLLPNQFAKSRDAQRKADIDRIRTALFDYYTDFACFPKTIPDCHNFSAYDHTEYFSYYRCDPKGLNYIYQPDSLVCPHSFEIFDNLENKDDPDVAKTNCTDGCGPGCKFNYSINSGNTPMLHDCPAKF